MESLKYVLSVHVLSVYVLREKVCQSLIYSKSSIKIFVLIFDFFDLFKEDFTPKCNAYGVKAQAVHGQILVSLLDLILGLIQTPWGCLLRSIHTVTRAESQPGCTRVVILAINTWKCFHICQQITANPSTAFNSPHNPAVK